MPENWNEDESDEPDIHNTSNDKAAENRELLAKRHTLKCIVEALLFSSSTPIPLHKIREVTDSCCELKPRALKNILEELQLEYVSQQRAFRLEETSSGYILRTSEAYAPYIELMQRNKRTEKLSQAAAEVLAIIAYKHPITRPQIESIRGVDCSGTIYSLLERSLIEPVGRLEAPGRPTLYSVTKDFLLYFGLRDLKQLPTLS